MDAVDDSRHVFSVVQVGCDRIEDLRIGVKNIHTHVIIIRFRWREGNTCMRYAMMEEMNERWGIAYPLCVVHFLTTTVPIIII